MKGKVANKIWFELYTKVGLFFNLVKDGTDYSVVFNTTKEKVLSFDEGMKLALKHNLIKIKK